MTASQRIRIFILALFFPVLAIPGFAKEDTGESPVATATRLQQRYDQLTSLTFTFIQNTKGSLSGRPRRATGKAFFLKNGATGKMRWNYVTPEEQVILSDGIMLKMYFAKLKQMILTPADSLQQDITYSFFSGSGNIVNDFIVLQPDPQYLDPENDVSLLRIIKLVPKSTQSQLKSIHLWISGDSLIQRIELQDHFDTLTLLNLSDLQVDQLTVENERALEKLFSFTPPEGTEIIQQ